MVRNGPRQRSQRVRRKDSRLSAESRTRSRIISWSLSPPGSVEKGTVPNYIGALDQGTTSTRFIVFDRAGQIVTTAQKEHRQIYPRPGWVEHDPEEIWI